MLIKQLLVLTAAMLVLMAFNQAKKSQSTQAISEELENRSVTSDESAD